jgi:hypothetical protein
MLLIRNNITMKKLFFILPLLILFSCSVQKRKYQKGFYVSNNKHQNKIQKTVARKPKKEVENNNVVLKTNTIPFFSSEEINLSASVDNKTALLKNVRLPLLTKSNDSLCDIIILKNGDEVKAKVLEISPIEIKYNKCNMSDGPLYVVKKSDVFMIKYANGLKELIKTEATPTTNSPSNNTPTNSYNGPLKTHSYAILAFIFSVLGFITYGLLSIFAIIFANMAIKKIKQEPNIYKGEPLAKAGKIMGIIMLTIIAIILIFALILAVSLI